MKQLDELAQPVPVLGERASLADALDELWKGRPALVLLANVPHLLHPSDVVGHQETRRLVDLPLVRVRPVPHDMPLWRALDQSRDADFIVVSRGGHEYSIATRQEVLEELLRVSAPNAPGKALTVVDVLDQSPEGVIVLDGKNCVHGLNPAARRFLSLLGGVEPGMPISDLGGIPIELLLQDARQGLPRDLVLHEPSHRVLSVRTLRSSEAGDAADTVFLLRDVTNARHRQAREAAQERMALLGQLASGIAHDMNNVLTVVAGCACLLEEEGKQNDPYLKEIGSAVDRASALMRQLLAFARREVTERVILNLPSVVRDMEGIIRRLSGDEVEVTFDLDEESPFVSADPVQVERILANLVVSARKSMPNGGRLEVAVRPCPACRHLPGKGQEPLTEAARMTVHDTGVGISPDTLAKIFEPYFTTDPAHGTGLGLATVRATVAELGGAVRVTSSMGSGTCFDICLPPATPDDRAIQLREARERRHTQGTGTLLIVERDAAVARITRSVLESAGYHVVQLATATEAIERVQSQGEPDLLIADAELRTLAGVPLCDELLRLFPRLRVLLMCGYATVDLTRQTRSPLVEHIAKPFSGSALLEQVERMVGASYEE